MDSFRRSRNSEINLQEYRSEAIRLTSLPRYIAIELTRGCNLNCPMCRREPVSFKGQTMTPDMFRSVASKLFDTAEMIDLRGWGESLVLPEFIECLRAATRSGAQVRVVTNLSFRRPAVLEALAETGCHVVVSLDSAESSVLAVLRPGAKLALIAENLCHLTTLYEHKWGTVDRIAIYCTVQRPALSGLPKLAEFASECGVAEIRLAAVSVPQKSSLSLCGVKPEVDLAVTRLAQATRNRGIALVATTQLGGLPENKDEIPACVRPWAFVLISYDGRVGFCDHLIGPLGDRFVMGDFRATPFEPIWNGSAWTTLRREHVSRRSAAAPNFSKCAECYKHRYVDFEDLFLTEASERKVFLKPRREWN